MEDNTKPNVELLAVQKLETRKAACHADAGVHPVGRRRNHNEILLREEAGVNAQHCFSTTGGFLMIRTLGFRAGFILLFSLVLLPAMAFSISPGCSDIVT